MFCKTSSAAEACVGGTYQRKRTGAITRPGRTVLLAVMASGTRAGTLPHLMAIARSGGVSREGLNGGLLPSVWAARSPRVHTVQNSCFFCAAGTKKVTVPSPATELKAQPSVEGSLQKVALVAEQDMLALRSMTSSPVPVPTLESTRVSPVAAVPWIIL